MEPEHPELCEKKQVAKEECGNGHPVDHNLCNVQARMAAQRERLATTRFKVEHPGVVEAARVSGQAIGSANSVLLEDLLRKPRVTHK